MELLDSMDCLDVNVVPEHERKELELSISGIKGEICALRTQQRCLDGKRREALNKILDIKGSIRVFCRVRSYIAMEKPKKQQLVLVGTEKISVRSTGVKKEFNVDRVFDQHATQEDAFLEVEPIIRSALDGHNVCIFAYGQTGTGKTYTMEGVNDKPGIVPRAIEELFQQACKDTSASFTFSMSMLEVYLGSLRDLLAQKHSSYRAMEPLRCGLNILTGSNGAVEVEGLTEVTISDYKQAKRWYSKGKRVRSTSWTNVNETSSRSHCLIRITIIRSGDMGKGNGVVSKLWMVDLGGSERLLKTGATGQTMDEGKAINLSLSALGDVIAALKRKHAHIPYRNSKLTQILSDSLGNGSKVLMIIHISPDEDDLGETICALNFARRVRAIESSRELSEESKKQKDKLVAGLKQDISSSEVELQKLGNQIERTENLLLEKQKLVEDLKGSPRSPLVIQHTEVAESPLTSEKALGKTYCHSSLPHFMISTACSRQRQYPAGETNHRLRKSRLGNVHSLDLVGSQSLSYLYHHPTTKPQSAKIANPVTCEVKTSKHRELNCLQNVQNISCNSADLKRSLVTRSRRVNSSYPNFRATLYQHRRRMSDLT